MNHDNKINEIRRMLNTPNILSLGPTLEDDLYFSYMIKTCGMNIYVYFDKVVILYADYRYTFSHIEFIQADTSNLVGWLANLKEKHTTELEIK